MIRYETKFALLFRHWLKANPQNSCTYELKDTRGKEYLNFSEIKNDQLNFGLAIQDKRGVLIRVQGSGGQPDYSYHRGDRAYIVIKYPTLFCMILIDELIKERLLKEASLSSERACAIADKIVYL